MAVVGLIVVPAYRMYLSRSGAVEAFQVMTFCVFPEIAASPVGAAGAVLSTVIVLLLVVAVTGVPAFPARSVKAILKARIPCGVSPSTVRLAVQSLAPVLVAVAAAPPRVTVGVAIVSVAVKFRVMTSPAFALLVLRLLDAMVTVLSVGTTLS
ncbi:hypothetical protein D3C87_185590 [compost metagenome]